MQNKLPEPLVLALAAAVGMLVAEGLKAIGEKMNKDFSGLVAGLASSITAALVAIVEGVLDLVPPTHQIYVQAILAALVVIFAPAGIHRQFVRFGGRVS